MHSSNLVQQPEYPQQEELQQLEHLLLSKLRNRLTQVRVLYRDEGLVLQGESPTYYIKQLAQHAVMNATNLPIRSNEIHVLG